MKVASSKELPLRMRTLGPRRRRPTARRASPIRRPTRGSSSRAHETVALAAAGGNGTLRWLVDGRPLDGTTWTPDGAGEMRVAVVDDAGRSSAVTVRIVRRP